MENSEGHEKSWKMIIMSCNFYRSCRSSRTVNELVLDSCGICKYMYKYIQVVLSF